MTLLNSPGPQQLSRASSSLSLASSVTEDVRHFSSNYEQLLREATASIRRLGRDKAALEAEQDRLLTVNLELAAEVKRLLQLDRDNKEERKVREGEVRQRPGRDQAEARQRSGRDTGSRRTNHLPANYIYLHFSHTRGHWRPIIQYGKLGSIYIQPSNIQTGNAKHKNYLGEKLNGLLQPIKIMSRECNWLADRTLAPLCPGPTLLLLLVVRTRAVSGVSTCQAGLQ